MTWTDALNECQATRPRSNLASIQDKSTNDFLTRMTGGKEHTWIGGYQGVNDKWFWSDGSKWTGYTNWGPGEPNNDGSGEDHIGLNRHGAGTWNDFPNNNKLGFLCQYDPILDIRDNNLLRTIPFFGPEYRISLEVFVNSFTVPNMQVGYYADILHFTSTDGNCCKVGGRIPSIFTRKDNKIAVCTQIGNNGNYHKDLDFVKEKWIKLEIQQYSVGGGEVIK